MGRRFPCDTNQLNMITYPFRLSKSFIILTTAALNLNPTVGWPQKSTKATKIRIYKWRLARKNSPAGRSSRFTTVCHFLLILRPLRFLAAISTAWFRLKRVIGLPIVKCFLGGRYRVRSLPCVLACCAVILPDAWADHGVTLPLGGNEVQLQIASPHAFLLHVSPAGMPPHGKSIFLSGTVQPETRFTVTHNGSITGIKTGFGELLVDEKTQQWSLHDRSGATLAPWSPLPKPSLPSVHSVVFKISPSSLKLHPRCYGSGNAPVLGALSQTEANSRAGNGSTSLPQYWSDAGYGTLLVTDNDNKPATWKAKSDGGVEWTIPGESADLYLMPAATLYEWLRNDSELTGFAPVPPRWSLGYLQSRWGWKDKAYIEETLARFRKDRLPVDAFIFDFEWYTKTPDYKVKAPGDPQFADFDWNPTLFPDPVDQIKALARQGLHIVGIRKPRAGNSENLKMARRLPTNPDDPNNPNIRTRNIDYSNPAARAWWEQNNRKFFEAGMSGFWNDEGETSYTEYSYWNLAGEDLLKQVDPNARFWSLNRSFAPGLQRFGAAAWTGDIHPDWETLARTPGQLLSYSLSGMPYSACDIGGFFDNPTPELLIRWMQAGVFFPILRSHSHLDSTPRFPWLYGQDAEAAIGKALNLRYQLIPYYYSLAFENDLTGVPLMRPLVMEFPGDDKVADMTDEWLMGKGLLVAPVLSQGGSRDIYLPNERWFRFGATSSIQGPQTLHAISKLDEIPIYVRAGTVLPIGPVLQHTGEAGSEPLELQIYPGRNATFDFIEDDGQTLNYRNGDFCRTSFSWNDQTKTLSWKITGSYKGKNCFRTLKAVLLSQQGATSRNVSLEHESSVSFQ